MDLLSTIVCYQNTEFYVMWKPSALPTTFGKESCFLDMLLGQQPSNIPDFAIPQFLLPYIDLPDFDPCTLDKKMIETQISAFGKDQELGLLNRLDNETSWFLYFAKTPQAFQTYRALQAQGKIHKRYIAQVQGQFNESAFEIDMPVMHHKYKSDRMVFVRTPKDEKKWRSKIHHPITIVKVLHVEKQTQISTLLVGIYKGVRHQIRVHLAGIGYPVIGDILYGKEEKVGNLRLWSVGFQIAE